MADEPKSASTAAKSARASSAKNKPAPGDPSSTTSDTGRNAGSTSTRTDTTALADQGKASTPGAGAATSSSDTHGTSGSDSTDTARPGDGATAQGNHSSTTEAAKEAVTGRPELGSGQRLAGGTEHDYPAQNSPRLSDPDEQANGGEPVEQFGAVGTLSPTRLSEDNRVGALTEDQRIAQFPTPRFNQGPPNVVVQSLVPPPFADQYTQITEDLFEVVYPPGTITPSSRLVAPAGSFVRTDFLTETMAHAAKDVLKATAAQGTNPGDTDKEEHRREVAQQ